MENGFNCAGACKTPLFYVSRNIEDTPEETCYNLILNNMGNVRTVGIIGILTGLISLCACCGSFPLCSKSDPDDDIRMDY